jgi:hypothetical protein
MKYPKRSQYKYAKSRYRIGNWPEYEAGLRQRGDLTGVPASACLRALTICCSVYRLFRIRSASSCPLFRGLWPGQ